MLLTTPNASCPAPPMLKYVMVLAKLQALVYDILPLEEGAGKRCSECGCQLYGKHCFVHRKLDCVHTASERVGEGIRT